MTSEITDKHSPKRRSSPPPLSQAATNMLEALLRAPTRQAFATQLEAQRGLEHTDEILSGVKLSAEGELRPGRLLGTGKDKGRLSAILLSLLSSDTQGSISANLRQSVKSIQFKVAWFPEMRGFVSLKTLHLEIDEFQEPSVPLHGMPSLERLTLIGVHGKGPSKGTFAGNKTSIKSFGGLDLPSLTALDVRGVSILESGSTKLPRLRAVRTGHANFLDLRFLRNSVKTLIGLDVQNCNGRVVLPDDCPCHLEQIVFWRNKSIEGVKWLDGSTNLRILRFEVPGEGGETITAHASPGCTLAPATVSEFAALTEAGDLTGISDSAAANIGELHLDRCYRLKNIDGAERFSRLTSLKVPPNVSSLIPLGACKSLERVFGSSVSTLSPARWPASLVELEIKASFRELGRLPPLCRVIGPELWHESTRLGQERPDTSHCLLDFRGFVFLEDLSDLESLDPTRVELIDLQGCTKLRALTGIARFRNLRQIRLPPFVENIDDIASMENLQISFDPPISPAIIKDLRRAAILRLADTLGAMNGVNVEGFDFTLTAESGAVPLQVDPDFLFAKIDADTKNCATIARAWRRNTNPMSPAIGTRTAAFEDITRAIAKIYPSANWAAMVRKKEVDPRDDPADHKDDIASDVITIFECLDEKDHVEFLNCYRRAVWYRMCVSDVMDDLFVFASTGTARWRWESAG